MDSYYLLIDLFCVFNMGRLYERDYDLFVTLVGNITLLLTGFLIICLLFYKQLFYT